MAMRVTVLGTTGDVDPFTYGGGVVYKSGDHLVWEWWDEPVEGERIRTYRAHLDADSLSFYSADMIKSAAATIGTTVADLRSHGKSKDWRERQQALEAIVLTWGGESVDSYPIEMTERELRHRWDRRLNTFHKNKWKSAAKGAGVKSAEEMASLDPAYLNRADRIRYAKAAMAYLAKDKPGSKDDFRRARAAETIRELAKRARARRKEVQKQKKTKK